MQLFSDAIANLYTMPFATALVWIFAENFFIVVISLLAGQWLVKAFKNRPICVQTKVSKAEITLGVCSLFLNTLVTVIGLILWRGGLINLRVSVSWRDLLDTLVLLAAMDFLMYLFHRVAHNHYVYKFLHEIHHRFEDPNPLTLFALNPLENLGFGALWLVVLIVYPTSWLSITIYLTLNVISGLIGHLGVEPFPHWWAKTPVISIITTSTFHAQHHKEGNCNFGFYTTVWDKLFKTLSPHYPAAFGQLPSTVGTEQLKPVLK